MKEKGARSIALPSITAITFIKFKKLTRLLPKDRIRNYI